MKNEFIDHQLLLSRQASARIDEIIHSLSRELELLSSMPAIIDMDDEKVYELLVQNFKHVKSDHVNDIAVLDSKGVVRIPLNAPHLRGKDFSFREYFKQASQLRIAAPVFEIIDFRGVDIGMKGILIAMPIFSGSREFGGLVVYTLKIDELFQAFLSSKFKEINFWIIGSNGSIVSHPIYEPGTKLGEQPGLNASFKTFLENIISGGEHNAEYRSPEGEKRIGVSHQAEIANQTWIFVISTPERVIIREFYQFANKYILGALIVILVIVTSSLITVYVFKRWNIELQKEIQRRKSAETELKAREEFLSSIFDSIQDGISILDKDLNIISTNKRMEQWYYHKRPLVSKKCYEAYHGRTEPCEICPSIRTLESGDVDFEAVPMTGPDGVRGWLEVFTYPLLEFGTGRLTGVIEYVRDITERKWAEDELKKNL